MALTDNIVAYWKLDESSGNASDSVGSITLTNNGSAVYAAGKINNGITCIANTDYLSASHSATFNFGTGAFSISFWAKLNDTTLNTTENMIRHYNSGGWVVQFKSTNREIQFYVTSGSPALATNKIPNDTNWHHYAFTRSGSTAKIYVDGVDQTTSGTVGSGTVDVTTDFYIGSNGVSEGFDGMVDEAGLWSRALTADDVSKLYNAGNGNQYPFTENLTTSLISYWKFDESSGNAADSSGNSVTLTNNNTVGYATGKIANAGDYGSANTNKYFNAANNLGINGGNISFNFWVNITTAPTNNTEQGFIGQFNSTNKINYRIYYTNESGTRKLYFNRLIAGVSNNGPTVTQTLNTGTWYMLTYTYDGTNVKGYLNASEIGSASGGSGTGSDNNYYNGVVVGSFNSSSLPDRPIKGLIDECGIWSRALTTDEITTLYNSGSGLTYPFTTTSIKTVDGLAIASVKTVDGLAIASVKNINGLA